LRERKSRCIVGFVAESKPTRTINETVAFNVKWLRRNILRRSQRELAVALEVFTGDEWSASKVSDIENAVTWKGTSERAKRQKRITVDELIALTQVFKVTLFELLLPIDDADVHWYLTEEHMDIPPEVLAHFLFGLPIEQAVRFRRAQLERTLIRTVMPQYFGRAADEGKHWSEVLPESFFPPSVNTEEFRDRIEDEWDDWRSWMDAYEQELN
jgi:hypothetical protein